MVTPNLLDPHSNDQLNFSNLRSVDPVLLPAMRVMGVLGAELGSEPCISTNRNYCEQSPICERWC